MVLKKKGKRAQIPSETQNRELGGGHIPKEKRMYPLKLLLHLYLICRVVKVLLHLKLTLLCLLAQLNFKK